MDIQKDSTGAIEVFEGSASDYNVSVRSTTDGIEIIASPTRDASLQNQIIPIIGTNRADCQAKAAATPRTGNQSFVYVTLDNPQVFQETSSSDSTPLEALIAVYRRADVPTVLVEGNDDAAANGTASESNGEGHVYLTVDTTTQLITTNEDVTSRTLVLPNGQTTDDFATEALPGVYAGDTDTWLQDFKAQKKAAAHKQPDVVFLGDSLFQRFISTGIAEWNADFLPKKTLDFGMTGDTTSQVLYRIQNGLFKGIRPGVIVLNIGTNNIALTDDLHSTFSGIEAIINTLQAGLPGVKIDLCPILPRHNALQNSTATKLNALLRTLDNGNSIRYVDTRLTYVGQQRFNDYTLENEVHLNEDGYSLWATDINRVLTETLEGQPSNPNYYE